MVMLCVLPPRVYFLVEMATLSSYVERILVRFGPTLNPRTV